MTKTAIILCGGKATRLGDLAKDTPKVLMHIKDDYTILDAQIDLLSKNGVNKVVLATGHLGDQVEEYLEYITGRGRYPKLIYRISREERPLGTGGAFKKAWQDCCELDESFIGLNGDVFCPTLDIKRMIEVSEANTEYSSCITMKKHDIPFGIIETIEHQSEGFHYILDFKEKQPVFINAGVYHIKPELMKIVLEKFSVEKDVFQHCGEKILGFDYDGPWFDLGTPETLEAAREFIAGM